MKRIYEAQCRLLCCRVKALQEGDGYLSTLWEKGFVHNSMQAKDTVWET